MQDAQELRNLLREYEVLVFRDQTLDEDQHVAVGRAFGELHRHPFAHLPGWPDILPVPTGDGIYPAAGFHTDATFEERPPSLAVLRHVHGPVVGGDTAWASMTAAYEGLTGPMQRFLSGLHATQDSTAKFPGRSSKVQATHPVVIVDEVSGKRALYVNSHHTRRIDELSDAESARVLRMLYEHVGRLEFQVRVRWTPGTVVIWDERLTQHYAIPDYQGQRLMHRVTVLGDAPAGPALGI